jgi:hypothetical protein
MPFSAHAQHDLGADTRGEFPEWPPPGALRIAACCTPKTAEGSRPMLDTERRIEYRPLLNEQGVQILQ